MQIGNVQIDSMKQISEKYFNYFGCNNCNNKLGNDITEYKAYFNKFTDYYEINLCDDCINAYYNSGNLPNGCKNIYKI